uniref:Integrin alpha-3-like n=1 Tax=Poecilia reticulata TaxID=8081 RepID=A0A3P9P8D9_POERE
FSNIKKFLTKINLPVSFVLFQTSLRKQTKSVTPPTSVPDRLLVGAPREKAEPHVAAYRTGGVYSCPYFIPVFCLCAVADLDPTKDQLEDMWLGVTVASQGRPGGRVLACGHRFVRVYQGDRKLIGRCYLHRIGPRRDEEPLNWDYRKDHTGEGMCTFGISAFITHTDAIFGSPGSYSWRGTCSVKSRPSMMSPSYVWLLPHLQVSTQTIVAGAPRDNKMDARGSVMLAVKRSNDLVIQQTLRGQQVGSYFGNVVVAVDLNSDGWKDLLVGAPFYFNRQQEVGGAVYVYMNAGGRFHSEPTVVLMGSVGSAFGMAVAAAGDLNQDGYQDFAVGAPFHDTGCVMIWTGSKDGISAKPSQMIEGRSVSPGFRTFGYSLAPGVDVDGNHYPDLLVGSLDDTVLISVLLFFSLTAVNFTVSGDVTSISPRLRFHDSRQSVYSSIQSSAIQNVVEPLVFSLNVSLNEKLPNRSNVVQNLKRFPILSPTPPLIKTMIHIEKACGSDNVCQSNLQMVARFTDEDHKPFPISIRRLFLEVNVSNTASPGRLAEDAHNTVLNISVPPSLVYSGVHKKAMKMRFLIPCSVEGASLLCQLGNPFRSNQKVNTHSCMWRSSCSITICLYSLLLCSRLRCSLNLSHLIKPGSVFFGGHVVGERAMKSTEDVGSPAVFTFQVHVQGKPLGHLGDLEVEFDWPKEVANGKWLLYLTEISLEGTSNRQCTHGDIINPLKLVVTMETTRENSPSPHWFRSTGVQKKSDHPNVLQNCSSGARCVKFSCPLLNMNNSATLTVKSRLWNSTMIEDYRDASSVLVQGQATLKLKTTKISASCLQIEVNIYPEFELQLNSGAPWWIIVVSVLAGVLLLALICVLLWKCGFFKRASTREMYEAKTQRAHMKSQPSDMDKLTEEL